MTPKKFFRHFLTLAQKCNITCQLQRTMIVLLATTSIATQSRREGVLNWYSVDRENVGACHYPLLNSVEVPLKYRPGDWKPPKRMLWYPCTIYPAVVLFMYWDGLDLFVSSERHIFVISLPCFELNRLYFVIGGIFIVNPLANFLFLPQPSKLSR